jgi:hypothetical protein
VPTPYLSNDILSASFRSTVEKNQLNGVRPFFENFQNSVFSKLFKNCEEFGKTYNTKNDA